MNSSFCKLDDRLTIVDIHQLDVLAVISLEVIVIKRWPFGKEGITFGCEHFCNFRVIDPLFHFFDNEITRDFVGLGIPEQIIKGLEHKAKATPRPVLFQNLLHFLWRRISNSPSNRTIERHAKNMIAALSNDVVIVFFNFLVPFRRHWLLYGGHNEICGTLKNCHTFRCFGSHRQHLNCR